MTADKDAASSLGAVLKLERDGAAFFRRANAIAADPRNRQLLDRLARERDEGARLTEEVAASASLKIVPSTEPTPYPFESVARVVCYACGYVTEDIPASCPQCGAARYSFEKEFTKAMVWGIVLSSSNALVRAVQAAMPPAGGALRSALESLLRREQALTAEAEGELASAKA